MTFDPIKGPAPIAQGTGGTLTIGGLRAGELAAWRVVISPTTQAPTLFGEGRFLRFFTQAIGMTGRADLTPRAPAARIGRPKPPAPRPFTLTGRIVEIAPGRITIAEGAIENNPKGGTTNG